MTFFFKKNTVFKSPITQKQSIFEHSYVSYGKRQKKCTIIVIQVILSYLTSPIFNSSSKSTGYFYCKGGSSSSNFQPKHAIASTRKKTNQNTFCCLSYRSSTVILPFLVSSIFLLQTHIFCMSFSSITNLNFDIKKLLHLEIFSSIIWQKKSWWTFDTAPSHMKHFRRFGTHSHKQTWSIFKLSGVKRICPRWRISCFRATVPYGQIFRRDVLHIRCGSYIICPAWRRRQGRSCHLHISSYDKVHLSQVWYLRRDRKPWCSVHFTHQHRQRKDLRVSVVLVLASHRPNVHGHPVPIHNHRLSQNASLLIVH